MTLEEYKMNLEKLSGSLAKKAIQSLAIPLTNELLAKIKNRIVVDGKDSAGGIIGSYSTKASYYNSEQFDRRSSFKPTGKRESAEYATINIKTRRAKLPKRQKILIKGKLTPFVPIKGYALGARERTSMYLPGGYKELRNIQGKPIDKVRLNYTGSNMVAYQQSVSDEYIVQGMTTKLSASIREGHEEKYNKKIYQASEMELKEYNEKLVEEFKELNLNILKGVSE